MTDFFSSTASFGFVITLIFFALAKFLQTKTKLSILNPIIVAAAAIILLLSIFKIDYSAYQKGAQIINFFLTPATICFAVPLYRQISVLKENAAAMALGILSGCLSSVASVIGFSLLFHFRKVLYLSLLPKSITTAIGIGLSSRIGGLPSVTVCAIMIAGVTGAVFAPIICRIFSINEPVAVGIAIGSSSHAIGTTKAFEMGNVQGAMSSLSIVISGLVTVIIVPFFVFS